MERQDMLETAIGIVDVGCRVARRVQADLENIRQITKDDRSPVTVADFAVQAVVAMGLRADDRNVLIVGEEKSDQLRSAEARPLLESVLRSVQRVHPDATAEDVLDALDACGHDATGDGYWALDPIDGTKGFLRGQQYAVALGRIEHGEVVLGVMGCPNLSRDHEAPLDEPAAQGVIYAAVAGGGGAWEIAGDDHIALEPRTTPDGDSGLRVCESVESGHSRRDDTRRILEHLGQPSTPVRLDSQCKYAVVARGQADAYIRMPTKKAYIERIWDHAAGMLIATEAGAIVTDISGSPLDFSHGRRLQANRGVICAAPGIHPRIIDAISELGIAAVT